MSATSTRGRKVLRAARRGFAAILLACAGAGCENPVAERSAPVAHLTVTPARDTLGVGSSRVIQAVATDSTGRVVEEPPLRWTSADSSVATVAADGTVRGTGVGSTHIFAAAGGVRAMVQIVVVSAVARIAIEDVKLEEGASVPLRATLFDAEGTVLLDRRVTWSISDSAVATLDYRGLVAIAPGAVTLTAASDGAQAKAAVTVVPARVVTLVTHPDLALVIVGGSRNILIERSSAARKLLDRPTEWRSSNPAIARATAAGRVEGVSPGTAVVTATSEGLSDSVVVRVLAYAAPEFKAVGAGGSLSCGLDQVGSAYCWGAGLDAALGPDAPFERVDYREMRPLPLPVATSIRFRAIATGGEYACGLTLAGSAYCWGREVAVAPVPGGMVFDSVAVGLGNRACGLARGGKAYCWGINPRAEGATQAGRTPAPVPGELSFGQISVGERHACGLVAGGAAHCWGSNSRGELGNGEMTYGSGANRDQPAPVPVLGSHRFREVSAGAYFSCGVTVDGAVYCWGGGPAVPGPEGSGMAVPVPVRASVPFTRLTTGGLHACGLTSGGLAYCWGYNYSGQLGTGVSGSTQSIVTPTRAGGSTEFAAISAGRAGTCAIAIDRRLYCWGNNSEAQAGQYRENVTPGANLAVPSPRPVLGQ
ncbi:MAG: Ig-like domain-containing protein [Gemmatimonadetes bacterium]|nr:Ig-like domain-containing protein [Gemmatimonadota bacterium]